MTGVTGASGVLIMVPIFSTFFDLPLPIVLGISLIVDIIASISVSSTYARSNNVEVKGILWILVGTILGAQFGSFFVISLSTTFIIFVIALGMIFFGVKMWRSGLSKDQHGSPVVSENISSYMKTPIGMILSGLVVGLSTGIFGAGGGLMIFILLYSFLKFPIKKAIGTSSFVMLLTAISGVVGYAHHGNLDIRLGLIIGLSAAVGGALSSILANKINERFLSEIVGGFFVFFAVMMLILKVVFPIFNLSF